MAEESPYSEKNGAPRRRRWPWLIAGVGGLLFLLAWLLPRFVAMDSLRPRIAAAAGAATGLPIKLNGPIRLRLLPRPFLRVSEIVVSGDAPFGVQISGLDVVLALGPLLKGAVEPAEIRLTGVKADIPDLARLRSWLEARRAAAREEEAGGASGRSFSLAVRDSAIEVAGAPLARSHRLRIGALDLSATPSAAGEVWTVAAAGAVDAVPLELEARLAPPLSLGRRAGALDLVFAGGRFSWRGTIVLPEDGRRLKVGGRITVSDAVPASLLAAWQALGGGAPPKRSLLPPILAQEVRLAASLKADDREIALSELSGRWGDSRLAGHVSWRSGPAALTAALSVNRLAAGALLPPADGRPLGGQGAGAPVNPGASALAFADGLRRALVRVGDAMPGGVDVRLQLAALGWRQAMLQDVDLSLAMRPRGPLRLSLKARTPDGGGANWAAELEGDGAPEGRPLRVSGGIELLRADQMLPAFGLQPQPMVGNLRHLNVQLAGVLDRAGRITLDPLLIGWDGAKAEGALILARADDGTAAARLSAALPALTLPRPAGEAKTTLTPERVLAPLAGLLESWPAGLTLAFDIRAPALHFGDTDLHRLAVTGSLEPAAGLAFDRLAASVAGMSIALSGAYSARAEPALALSGRVRVEAAQTLAARIAQPDLAPLLARLPAEWALAGRLAPRALALEISGRGEKADLSGRVKLAWTEEGESPTIDLAADVASARLSQLLAPPLIADPDSPVPALATALGDRASLRLTLVGDLTAPRAAVQGELLGGAVDLQLAPPAEKGGDYRLSWRVRHADIAPALRSVAPARGSSVAAPLAFAAAGSAALSVERWEGRSTLEIGDSRLALTLTGRAQAQETPGGDRALALRIALRGARLNLDALGMGEGAAQPARKENGGPAGPPWSREPFGPLLPDGVDSLELEAALDEVIWRAEQWQGLRLALQGTREALTLSRLAVSGLGGDLALDGRIAGQRNRALAADLTVKGIELARALALAGLPARVHGRLSGGLRLKSEGASSFGLASALAGEGRLVLAAPRVAGFDLDALARDLTSPRPQSQGLVGRVLGSLVTRALERGETRFADTTVPLAIADGIARIGPMTLESAETTMELRLAADLPGWRLQGGGSAVLKVQPQAPALTLRISGPLDAPKLSWRSEALRDWLKSRISPPGPTALPEDSPELAPPEILPPAGVSESAAGEAAPGADNGPSSKGREILELFGTILQGMKANRREGGQDDGDGRKDEEQSPP